MTHTYTYFKGEVKMDNGMYNNNGGFDNNLNMPQQPQFPQQPQNNGKAIAALVLGICSIVFACLIPIVGLVLGIVGVVFAVLSNKEGKTNMALAGMITGIIGIVFSIIVWIINIIILTNAENIYSMFS